MKRDKFQDGYQVVYIDTIEDLLRVSCFNAKKCCYMINRDRLSSVVIDVYVNRDGLYTHHIHPKYAEYLIGKTNVFVCFRNLVYWVKHTYSQDLVTGEYYGWGRIFTDIEVKSLLESKHGVYQRVTA
jgi:hypothetical protein